MTILPVLRLMGEAQVGALTLSPGGEVGAHAAAGPQLLWVTSGSGWVSGTDGARARIAQGQAVLWYDGEMHAAGTDEGMTALILEGDILDVMLPG